MAEPSPDTIDVRFILEVHVKGQATPRRMVIPPVSRYAPNFRPATVRDWTLGDRPVKQKMGLREGTISISGVSGGSKRRKSYSRDGVELTDTGRALFVEFVEFIKRYELEGKTHEGPLQRDPDKAPRLVLRSMQDQATDENWYVEIQNFQVVRDTEGARLIRSFSLDLVTEGLVSDERVAAAATDRAAVAAGLTKSIDAVTGAVTYLDATGLLAGTLGADGEFVPVDFSTDLTVTVDAVRITSLAELRDELPARWTQMRAPVETFMRACQSAREVAGVVRTYVNFPSVVANDIADAAVDAIESLEAFADAVPLGAGREDARAWFARAYGMIEDVRARTLTSLGMSGARYAPRADHATAGTSTDGSFTSVAGVPCISVALEQGETLPAFAQRTMGDPDRWPELLEINQMASPFTGPDGAPLTPGLVLRVPALDGIAGTSAPELFGVDLQMDDSDALVLDGTTDFALVRGPANLNQALRRRLLARRGENLAFPQWGMPALVGEGAIGGTAAYVAAETRAQMLRDNRIRTVTRVTVTREGGVFVVSFDAKTADGGTIPVVTPFPT
jgi:hypothetical protein